MRLFRRLWFLLTRRRRTAELREEMRLHVELRALANRRDGLEVGAADRAARRRFGDPLRLSEESADEWGFQFVDHARQDVRHAIRHLAQRPTWAATIVLTLAIGIGANASVFALVNAILFAPIGGTHPDRLIWVAARSKASASTSRVSYPDYVAYRDRATTLSGLLAYSDTTFSVGLRPAARIFGGLVSGNYFDVLGIRPALGRLLAPDDDRPDHAAVVVVSDALWRERLGAHPSVVGATLSINGVPFTIVGVAPQGFVGAEFGEDAELWVPVAVRSMGVRSLGSPADLLDRDSGWLQLAGRLHDGVTLAQAGAEIAGIAETLRPDAPPTHRLSAVVAPGTGDPPSGRSDAEQALALLGLVPLLVLLVACSNVGNVIMANNVDRRREFAMRRAVGASRGRLIQQLLVEALLLALAAAVLGLLVSNGLSRLVAYLGDIPPGDLATIIGPNLRVMAATTVLATATVVLFGLLPAMAATRIDLVSVLKNDGDRGATGRGRLRNAFIVVQVSLSVTLLIAAGLFLQSLGRALRVDPGFEARGAASASFDPALQGYSSDREVQFVSQLLERTGSIPGVTSTAITTALPLSGFGHSARLLTDRPEGIPVAADWASVTSRYFETMRTPIVAGRPFTEGDAKGSPAVAIVNEALAASLWPNQSPLGQRMRRDASSAPWLDVVGVVRTGKYGQLTEPPTPAFFVPFSQFVSSPMTLVARTSGDVSGLTRALTAAGAEMDPDLPIYRAEPLTVTIQKRAVRQQAVAALLGVLGALTLGLAAIGLYGVAAHSASTRVREIGVRMALGALGGDVVRLFVGSGLKLTGIGIAVGLALSAAASRLLASFLFGLGATDAVTFLSSAAILSAVAAIATYLPARRAARLNPVQALRQL